MHMLWDGGCSGGFGFVRERNGRRGELLPRRHMRRRQPLYGKRPLRQSASPQLWTDHVLRNTQGLRRRQYLHKRLVQTSVRVVYEYALLHGRRLLRTWAELFLLLAADDAVLRGAGPLLRAGPDLLWRGLLSARKTAMLRESEPLLRSQPNLLSRGDAMLQPRSDMLQRRMRPERRLLLLRNRFLLGKNRIMLPAGGWSVPGRPTHLHACGPVPAEVRELSRD